MQKKEAENINDITLEKLILKLPLIISKRFILCQDFEHTKIYLLDLISSKKMHMSSYSEELKIALPNFSSYIEKLVAEGLILKEPDNNDRRKVFLCLTIEGQEYLNSSLKAIEQTIKTDLESFSKEEQEKLHESLSEIYKILYSNCNEKNQNER